MGSKPTTYQNESRMLKSFGYCVLFSFSPSLIYLHCIVPVVVLVLSPLSIVRNAFLSSPISIAFYGNSYGSHSHASLSMTYLPETNDNEVVAYGYSEIYAIEAMI